MDFGLIANNVSVDIVKMKTIEKSFRLEKEYETEYAGRAIQPIELNKLFGVASDQHLIDVRKKQ